MGWLWFLAGAIVGVSLGTVVTCTIVFDRELSRMEEGDREHDNY